MSLVTITLDNKSFKLLCSEKDKHHLFSLVDILNSEIDRVKKDNTKASFDLILIIIVLNLINDQQKIISSSYDELKDIKSSLHPLLIKVLSKLKCIVEEYKI